MEDVAAVGDGDVVADLEGVGEVLELVELF